MSSTGQDPAADGPSNGGRMEETAFSSLLEDSAEDLYENAPCGYLSTLLDGQIAKINGTLLGWLGYSRDELVGCRYFADLLTVGGRIYHETHFAPLLSMQGEIGGVALELLAADGTRLPVLITSAVKTSPAGEPLLIRTTVFDARDRRAYEQELLRAREESELERQRLQHLVNTLQRSLLPPALPVVPGLEAVAHYTGALHSGVRRRGGRGFLRPVPPQPGPVGTVPGRRLRQGCPRCRRDLADPLHPARRRSLRPGSGHRPDRAQHGPARGVPARPAELLHRDLRAAHPRRRRLHPCLRQWRPPRPPS